MQRKIAALSPETYALDERSLLDHLRSVQQFGQRLRFHDSADNSAHHKRFWHGLLDFNDTELAEMALLAEQPELLAGRADLKQKYAKPHYALLLTFIQLLAYPALRFKQLTQAHLDYCYQSCLQFVSREGREDQAHVIFQLAESAEPLAIKAGTRVNAGTDQQDQPIEFALDHDILLNHAQVSDIKVVQFEQSITSLADSREFHQAGISGFDAILRHALGGIEHLPGWAGERGKKRQIDSEYLLENWLLPLWRNPGKMVDDQQRAYIVEQLNFTNVSDWQYVFDVLLREVKRGQVNVGPIETGEWQRVYRILAKVHQQTQIKQQLTEIKALHLEQGLEVLFNWLFGEPEPGFMLYALPKLNLPTYSEEQQKKIAIHPLVQLYFVSDRAATRYIEDHLCLSLTHFRQIFARILGESNALPWPQVYRLLAQAWRKKRHMAFTSVDQKHISAMHTKSLYSGTQDSQISAFEPFGLSQTEGVDKVDMGLLLCSDTLQMVEGQRHVDVVLDCKPNSLPIEQLQTLESELIDGQPQSIFKVYLSTEKGWQATQN
ncbi:MAG: hypothetical protein HRT35_29325, partial [Algicola sp.]|nr:hypothetical protein [Algicola sp.]